MNHEFFIQRCFQLALNGLGSVAPNPLVGAVLVHEGKIIGEGFHALYGESHAEVIAIRNCKYPNLLPFSTLYINLEPCSHFGKTPPCVNLIIEKKISRVVISNKDPFPEVSGRGIELLKHAGIEVIVGVLKEQGEIINRRFFTFHNLKRPFILLKWAQSIDGFMDASDIKPIKISNTETDRLVHEWRSQESAILVGFHTAKKDNPRLTSRLFPGINPQRIIWDPKLELPNTLNVFTDGLITWVFNTIKEENNENIRFKKATSIHEILTCLYEQNIQSVIIEGGARTLSAFINENLWDEARVITGNISIGNGTVSPRLNHASHYKTDQINEDTIHYFINTILSYNE